MNRWLRGALYAALGCGLFAGGASAQGAGEARIGGLAGRLADLADTDEDGAAGLAERLGLRIRTEGGRRLVPVILEPRAGRRGREIDPAAIAAAGGRIDAASESFVRVLVPARAIRRLARHPHVSVVRTPAIPNAQHGLGPNLSEAVALTGAEDLHGAGVDGAGVKVAVIDLGFTGLTTRKAEGNLPLATVGVDFSGTGLETGTKHGTGVAEHVMDMAPGAILYCLKVGDEVDLENAAAYLRTNGIRVANHSVGWVNSSYYDDTGAINAIVNASRDTDGIFWTVAAGNDARRHWRGGWTDADADNLLEFSGVDERLNLTTASASVSLFLNWDQYGNSVTDLDFYVRDRNNRIVAGSEGAQTGAQDPAEATGFTYSASAAPYTIEVVRYSGPTAGLDITIFSFYNELEYAVAASSMADPANAHGAFTIAAINQSQWNLASPPPEPFSSQGPTNDGRAKPDLASPDGTTSAAYGAAASFGTSFSAPTAAGAAALLLEEDPSRSAGDLAADLRALAIDIGAPGDDSVFGAGKLRLQLTGCVAHAECDDGLFCNGIETCVAGACTDGAAPCGDGVACTTDTCDEGAGCSNTPNPTACNDGNACTSDVCDLALGCQNPPADGTACSDGNACTAGDVCAAGACAAGAPISCDDGVACTTDTCSPATGCANTPVAAACNDGNPCTTDACSPLTGCGQTPVANGTSCADGNACNGAETCQAGSCAAGAPPVCDDGAFCNGAETCDAALGCRPGTAPCAPDGVACTNDCDEGADLCAYAPDDGACNDGDVCTADVCHPVTGCGNTEIQPPPPQCAPVPVTIASDNFESGNYSGGTGWRASWSRSGDVSIVTDSGPHGGTRHARLRRGTGLMTRGIDMTGVTGAHLILWAKGTSFEGNEHAVVQVSKDGNTWTTLRTWNAAAANGVYSAWDFDLSAMAPYGNNFRVRVDANMGGTDDQFYLDDLVMQGIR